ncbi:carboxylate-amine ligase [Actinoplanes xinjiangensis]|uniref:carboxylate-amine ligase n=1 Tax=Actinoplanes xinjiangensis TaxID=512350 RepID=UPI001EF353ED|nr:glutamate-cysteine ligase family protein [Actinoplanes xinjiangensis]
MGVEEEFLLLDPSGAVAPAAPDVMRRVGDDAGITPEYMAYQLETATAVCTGLDELRRELTRMRLTAAEAAEAAGVHLVASGAPPFRAGPLDALSDGERYRRLAERFPESTVAGGTCGCHVHIGIPDRELATAVLSRIRPWLPALLALTVNSPVSGDGDTGWSSFRYQNQLCWPTFRLPEVWPSAESYDREVRSLVAAGTAVDASGIYFLARLSARYPTIGTGRGHRPERGGHGAVRRCHPGTGGHPDRGHPHAGEGDARPGTGGQRAVARGGPGRGRADRPAAGTDHPAARCGR